MNGIGGLMATAASTFAASDTGAAAQSAGRVAEGNYAFDNMQMHNVQGNKWDTNRNYAAGQNTEQLANGATVMQTAGGGMVVNTAGGMSNLASHINFAKMQQSMAQQQLRNSEAETQSSLEGWRHDSADTFQRLKSFASRHGDNFSMGTDSRSGMSSQASQGVQQVMDAVRSYMKAHGGTESDAYSELERKSRAASVEGSAGVRPFGIGIEVKGSASSGSDSSVTQSGSIDDSTRESQDARLAHSFSEGLNMVRSASVDSTAGDVESDAKDSLKQVQNSIQETDNHYRDYSRSKSRTQELSHMASMSDSESATVTSNLNQEFVAWLQEKKPAEARQLLTNTDSAENREQVAQYANEFVAERVKGRLDQHHQRAESGSKTGFGVGSPGHEASQPDKSAQAATPRATKPSHPAEGAAKPRGQSSGSEQSAGAPVPSNNQQRFEDEKAAMMKESNDFRQRVRDQQQERKLTVGSSEDTITSRKDEVENDSEQVKQHYEQKNKSVSKDIEHSKNYQKTTSIFDKDNAENIRKK